MQCRAKCWRWQWQISTVTKSRIQGPKHLVEVSIRSKSSFKQTSAYVIQLNNKCLPLLHCLATWKLTRTENYQLSMSTGAQVLVQRLWEQPLLGKGSTVVKHKERHSIQNGYNPLLCQFHQVWSTHAKPCPIHQHTVVRGFGGPELWPSYYSSSNSHFEQVSWLWSQSYILAMTLKISFSLDISAALF